MNKITIVNDQINKINLNKSIDMSFCEKECLFGINKLIIEIKKNTSLNIEIKLEDISKLEIVIKVLENKTSNLNIYTLGDSGKIKYKYELGKNSICNVTKFSSVSDIREMVIADLNNEYSNLNYNFKTICTNQEKYDFMIYHKYNNTVSNIKNNGVNIKEGKLNYQVSTFIPKDIKGAIANQFNRIMNLTDNKCEIKPNLYIDSYDISANHSALIGKFSDEEMFYLKSRGIDEESALKLLITGFLLSGIESKEIKNKIIKTINKYWR